MRIGVIGSGISGLGAAWLLRHHHEVVIYEAGDHIGGHTHTHQLAGPDGTDTRVDTGFIVFNRRNYPNLCRLFEEIGISGRDSTMSFSVDDPGKQLYWNGHSLALAFAQRRNLLRPRFYGMLRDILRFNRYAETLLEAPADLTVGEVIEASGVGAWCRDDYILPMGSAIWSASTDQVTTMPARFFARFLHNHGMLTVADRPQWMTVKGGSRAYVDRLLTDLPNTVRMDPVQQVTRCDDGTVEVVSHDGRDKFDRVIMAAHADQALRLLAQPSPDEQAVLASFPYAANTALLHHDTSILPPKRAWAAWNAHVGGGPQAPASVTYHANILQGITGPTQWLVTLGDDSRVDNQHRIKQLSYEHPQFGSASLTAQGQPDIISGVDRIHYAGAYWGFGFHEDGFSSAVRVAKELGVAW